MGSLTRRDQIAAEIRAEMARQRKTGIELASLLHCSQQSASLRVNGRVGLSLDEFSLICEWLDIDPGALIGRATKGAA